MDLDDVVEVKTEGSPQAFARHQAGRPLKNHPGGFVRTLPVPAPVHHRLAAGAACEPAAFF